MSTAPATRSVQRSQAMRKAAARLLAGYDRPYGEASGGGVADSVRPVIARARQALITDVDENEYVDYSLGAGAMLLGYADERVVAAISKAASKGFGFGLAGEGELRLAEMIAARFPAVDQVSFVSGVSQAFELVVTGARDFTGRRGILTFEAAPSTAWIEPDPAAPPPPPYNDEPGVERVFKQQGEDIAAVIVEAAATGAGVVEPTDEFIAATRRLCDKHKALLILDHSQTALRYRSSTVTVVPDVTIIGAVIGGGFSLAACAGRRDVMAALADAGGWRLACAVNAVAAAAGLATMQAASEPETLERLDALAIRLETGLRDVAATIGSNVAVARAGSIVSFTFPVDAAASDGQSPLHRDRQHQFLDAMLERGVYLPERPPGCLFLAAAHTDADIDRTIDAARSAAAAILS